jgi:signal transduction histidine kinase
VALIHGTTVSVDPRLARAAAAASAFALDAARLEAEVRTRSVEVSASRGRLLSVADAERRSLEQRLNEGVLARLRRVERLFVTQGDAGERLGAEVRATIVELTALGRGLYPPALARVDMMRALAEIAERSPVPTLVEAEGELASLSEAHRATIWFICSEGLANVARHSNATNAAVVLRKRDHSVELEIRDNGRGAAVPGRGLRGITDRVDALGGSVVLSSPSGGPTTLRAQLPTAAES